MAEVLTNDGILEEPCASCDKCYVENIWNEFCCDEKHCVRPEEHKVTMDTLGCDSRRHYGTSR